MGGVQLCMVLNVIRCMKKSVPRFLILEAQSDIQMLQIDNGIH